MRQIILICLRHATIEVTQSHNPPFEKAAGFSLNTTRTPNPAAALGVWVFLVSVAAQLLFLLGHSRLTENFSMFGQPISDAERWHLLAADLASGRGLSGSLRALYSMLLALVFVWSGPSVFAAKLVNIVLDSLSIGLASSIFARVLNLQTGVATALFMLLDFQSLHLTPMLLTEHPGLCFFALSVYFLLRSFTARTGAVPCVLAGVFLAFSNLARPLTLLSACFFIPYLFVKSRERGPARARNALLFMAGMSICLAPWIVRQRVVAGSYSISTNSMEAFWAATDPKWGTWSPAAIADARKENPPRSAAESEKFFRDKALQNLRRDPFFYCKNVSASFWTSLNWPIPMAGAVAAGLVLLAAAIFTTYSGQRGSVRNSSRAQIVLSIIVCIAAIWWSPAIMVLSGVLFCFFLNVPYAAILAAALLSTLLTDAAFAMPLARLNHLFDWLRLGFVVFAWQQSLTCLFVNLRKVISLQSADAALSRGALALSKGYDAYLRNIISFFLQLRSKAVFALLAAIAVSACAVAIKNIKGAPLLPLPRLTFAEKREILLEGVRKNPDLIQTSDIAEALDEKRKITKRIEGRLVADVVELPYFGYDIRAGEGKRAPSFLFSARSYEHTILHARTAIYGMRYVVVPGKLPAALLKQRVIIIARLHQEAIEDGAGFIPPPSFETIALIPLDPADGSLRWEKEVSPKQAAHRALLQKISETGE